MGNSVIVPPGAYYLCDPCYVVPDEDWDKVIDSSDCFTYPEAKLKEYSVYAFSTAYGDGTYFDQHGNEYGVDAGVIGLTPVYKVPTPRDVATITIKLFNKPTLCRSIGNSELHFGDTVIVTDGSDEEENQ